MPPARLVRSKEKCPYGGKKKQLTSSAETIVDTIPAPRPPYNSEIRIAAMNRRYGKR